MISGRFVSAALAARRRVPVSVLAKMAGLPGRAAALRRVSRLQVLVDPVAPAVIASKLRRISPRAVRGHLVATAITAAQLRRITPPVKDLPVIPADIAVATVFGSPVQRRQAMIALKRAPGQTRRRQVIPPAVLARQIAKRRVQARRRQMKRRAKGQRRQARRGLVRYTAATPAPPAVAMSRQGRWAQRRRQLSVMAYHPPDVIRSQTVRFPFPRINASRMRLTEPRRRHPRFPNLAGRGYVVPLYSPGLQSAWDQGGELAGLWGTIKKRVKKLKRGIRKHWKKIVIVGAVAAGVWFGGPAVIKFGMMALKAGAPAIVGAVAAGKAGGGEVVEEVEYYGPPMPAGMPGYETDQVTQQRVAQDAATAAAARRASIIAWTQQAAKAAGAVLAVKAAGAAPGSIMDIQRDYTGGITATAPGSVSYATAADRAAADTRAASGMPMMAGMFTSALPWLVAGAVLFVVIRR